MKSICLEKFKIEVRYKMYKYKCVQIEIELVLYRLYWKTLKNM